jgi:two-component sensor histidine kinase
LIRKGLSRVLGVRGIVIRKILTSRLPERFAVRVPPVVIELGVAIVAALLFVLVRIALAPLAGDGAPYAFVFVSVAIACVAAGWRSGLAALIIGQGLVWALIASAAAVQPATAGDRLGGFVIATISQLILLVTIALYQREVDKGTREREQRMSLLDEALKEIDHRTRNNYQTVLAMIALQSRRAPSDEVRASLRQVSDRIEAIANASQQLAARSADLGRVRLDDHLCGLVHQIEKGLSRDGIDVACDVDDVTADPGKATSISIIVNELVTNAIKHAFNGERTGHVRVTGKSGKPFELVVADNGGGMKEPMRNGDSGLGTKLVQSFARQLGAKHQVTSTDEGTTHRLLIPTLD